MITSEDFPFVFANWCLAKNFLRVPNIVCIHRPRAGSISKENADTFDTKAYLHKKISSFIQGTKALDEMISSIDFFKEHPSARHSVLNYFYQKSFSYCKYMSSIYAKQPAFEIDELAKKEFHPDDADFAVYLFGAFIRSQTQVNKLKKENEELKLKLNQQ